MPNLIRHLLPALTSTLATVPAVLSATLLLVACGTTPKANLYTLDDGSLLGGQGDGPSVQILSASLPELLDRPQLVLRRDDKRIVISEQQRWAEPLRSGIPRIVAADLGRLLNSARVVALPSGAPRFDTDFRLTLHVQRLEAQVGQGVDLDLVWVLQSRQGEEILGRSKAHESVTETAESESAVATLVTAQRRALGRATAEIATAIKNHALSVAIP